MEGFTFNDVIATIQQIKPMLLSHHPDCPQYSNDVIHMGKIRLCIGCFVGYPSAIISIVVSYYGTLPNLSPKYNFLYLIITFSLISAILLSLTKYTKKKGIKVLQKILIGGGSGMLIGFTLFRVNFNSIFQMIAAVWLMAVILIIPISLLRYRSMVRQCSECLWKDSNEKCPLFPFSHPNFESTTNL